MKLQMYASDRGNTVHRSPAPVWDIANYNDKALMAKDGTCFVVLDLEATHAPVSVQPEIDEKTLKFNGWWPQ